MEKEDIYNKLFLTNPKAPGSIQLVFENQEGDTKVSDIFQFLSNLFTHGLKYFYSDSDNDNVDLDKLSIKQFERIREYFLGISIDVKLKISSPFSPVYHNNKLTTNIDEKKIDNLLNIYANLDDMPTICQPKNYSEIKIKKIDEETKTYLEKMTKINIEDKNNLENYSLTLKSEYKIYTINFKYYIHK